MIKDHMHERSLISLFAGAGGLDIGLEIAGFKAVVVNELQPHACATLRENRRLSKIKSDEFLVWFEQQMLQKCWRNAPEQTTRSLKTRLQADLPRSKFLQSAEIVECDIRSLSSEDILIAGKMKPGEVCLVAGGPPCQPFSRAGKRESVEVADGRLFLEFVRVVNDLRPRWFLFENVKGLILTATDVVTADCIKCENRRTVSFEERRMYLAGEEQSAVCRACGCSDVTLHAERKRGGSLDIILNEFEAIGYTCQHAVLNAADYGAPQIRERLIIIGSRDEELFIWPRRTHGNKATSKALPLFPEKSLAQWISIREALWQEGHPQYGTLDEAKSVLWVKNVVRPHDEPVTWSLDRPSPTIGAHQSAKLAIAPFGVPSEQLARQQWHTLGRRQSDLPAVPVEHAYLSDLELLRLQTFPENWYLHGTRMERAFQIGNAVPVTLARVLGEAIMEACEMTEALLSKQRVVGVR